MARRRTLRAKALLPALALATAAAAGCAESTTGGGGTANGGAPVIEAGHLTTCTHMDYKPFEFHDQGNVVGFDVDLIDSIAKDMGLQRKIVDTPFEGIQSGEDLNTRRCDVAAAAMSITPTRAENFDFSDPYFEATQALLAKKESNIRGLADLHGKTLGVQLSTTGEQYANDNKAANGYEVVQFEDLPLSVTAVQTGQVAAAINDNSVLADYVKNNPEVAITAEFTTGDHYGIGVAKGNTALKDQVNASLKKIKENGEYGKIYEKWFGKKPQ
ncbi:basic amino acid ABC transporter substrate-binding protein [Saccharopolyspora phatthalungensis]|uniref:Polar amino acid transport system substrate-binding protein n=1 Tax=Saccharopolyspora phatthalungensis TaxID=664693 RepID=A0A840QBX9_9PSEU|nr:basic amino acid ABC transporter substrate-binding protein [Saccharopolyspora phatthalungensis]MBB5154373.1 polar amino acid transport system substrate-binding protein [Saccharopolyspora phatthalungensis]